MNDTKVASRYAKSLFGLAHERNILEVINSDMNLVAGTCASSRDLVLFLKNPIINADKKKAILNTLFGSRVNPVTLAFFNIITLKRREMYLDGIATEFTNIYKKNKGIATAVITSAAGLDAELRKAVIDVVKNSVKSEVELVERTDKNLIGGFTLQVGDKQFDATIAKKLKQLALEFSNNLYVKKN